MTESEAAAPQRREARDREHFDRIATTYADKDLHPAARVARRRRLEATAALADWPGDARLLEIGCGAGFAAEYLEGRYGRYLGIDHSERLVAAARARHAGPGVTFRRLSAHELEPGEPFDVVLMVGVLHHVEGFEALVERLVLQLRPGGWLVANEPQPSNPLVGRLRRLRKRLDAAYADDQRELGPEELAAAFAAAGLEAVTTRGQGLLSTPFAEVMLSPSWLTAPLARASCALDRWTERVLPGLARRLAWNAIVAGRRPGGAAAEAGTP